MSQLEQAVLHYFTDTNSSHGYVDFSESSFGGLQRVETLHGFPSAFMAEVAQGLCRRAEQEGLAVELVHNCLDNSLEGVIFPERSAGVRNMPAYRENNALAFLDGGELESTSDCIAKAHGLFAEALKIHDGWERVYITELHKKEADRLAEETAEKLLAGRKKAGEGKAFHRFFGAATASGSFDYIDNLSKGLQNRWFLKGRPGTGKSTFLRKIAGAAQKAGFTAEVYHCAFDPDSLDMVVVRELGFCVFDSTSPHEYFPTQPQDAIIDIYEAAVTPGTDERNAAVLKQFREEYKEHVARATEQLYEAKAHYDLAQRLCFANVPEKRLRMVMERVQTSVLA